MTKDFFELYGNICTEEQLYRISNDSDIKSKIENKSENELVYKAICYILQHDYNWIISLSRFLENISNYNSLIEDISSHKINDELIKLFIEVVSDTNNYFEILTYSDLTHYKNKKNEICLNILNGEFDKIPDILKRFHTFYTEADLYKFALLEYKFGISFLDALALVERYGKDINELPEGTLKDYLKLLNEIVYCDNIKDVIQYALENGKLKEPWQGFPNAREAEGKILDLFAELYNQTLYKPIPEDKEDYLESYTDLDGTQYDIEVYKIKKDFRMDIRVEGTFKKSSLWNGNKTNYAHYYSRDKIYYHGNSESYISNANISIAESDTTDIIVGYEQIYPNQLAAASPKVKSTSTNGLITFTKGNQFSMFGADNINLRTPNNMIDNTRITGTSGSSTGYRGNYKF